MRIAIRSWVNSCTGARGLQFYDNAGTPAALQGSAQFIRAWMPEGIEKVWALRTISLSHQSTDILGAFLTPRLCRHGLDYACRSLGTFCAAVAVVFCALARESPPPPPALQPSPDATDAAAQTSTFVDENGNKSEAKLPKEAKKAVEWRIFRVPACRAMVLYWLSCGNIYMNSAFCAWLRFVAVPHTMYTSN